MSAHARSRGTLGRAGDRVLARLATGPLGRLAAFVTDLAVYWWRWARERLAGRLSR